MPVEDIMSKVVFSLDPEDTLTKFISLMEDEHVHEVPVIKDHKLIGLLRYKNIIARGGISDPSVQKVKSLMDFKPPTVSPTTSIEDAAKLIFNTGIRAIPVVEDGGIVGIVSVYDIVEETAKMKEFRQTNAESIMSEARTITADDDIGKARTIMREHNISRLPIVSASGELVGIVDAHDMLKSFKHPKEKMGWYSMAAEMDKINAIPVSTIMNDQPVIATRKTTLSDIALMMAESKISGIVIVEDKKPIGVVTTKDLLEVYVGGLVKKGVYCQVIGLTEEEDFVSETIDRMITDTTNRISNITPVQFMFVHFKRHSIKGLKIKYGVRVRVMTDKGMFIASSWAWDARDAVKKGLDIVENSFRKWKDTIKTKEIKGNLKLKQMRG